MLVDANRLGVVPDRTLLLVGIAAPVDLGSPIVLAWVGKGGVEENTGTGWDDGRWHVVDRRSDVLDRDRDRLDQLSSVVVGDGNGDLVASRVGVGVAAADSSGGRSSGGPIDDVGGASISLSVRPVDRVREGFDRSSGEAAEAVVGEREQLRGGHGLSFIDCRQCRLGLPRGGGVLDGDVE